MLAGCGVHGTVAGSCQPIGTLALGHCWLGLSKNTDFREVLEGNNSRFPDDFQKKILFEDMILLVSLKFEKNRSSQSPI
jgi:hypothetical protein